MEILICVSVIPKGHAVEAASEKASGDKLPHVYHAIAGRNSLMIDRDVHQMRWIRQIERPVIYRFALQMPNVATHSLDPR